MVKTKALIITALLISTFAFAYVKSRFSYDMAHVHGSSNKEWDFSQNVHSCFYKSFLTHTNCKSEYISSLVDYYK